MAGQQNGGHTGRSFEKVMQDFGRTFSSMKYPSEFVVLLTYFTVMYAPIRICVEAGVFRNLAASSQPLSAAELIKHLKGPADTDQGVVEREEYMTRMLSAVCSINLADETGPHVYAANDLTRTLAEPGFESGFIFLHDTTMGNHSTNQHMLLWAKDNGYKAPTTSTDGPYQQARGIAGTSTFEDWTKLNPHHMSNLSKLMSRIQKDRLNWSEWFPADVIFQSDTAGSEHEVFMVDVGGGLGHDLSGFAARYPDKKIRLVLEDQPEVIAEAKAEKNDPRVELLDHDFFSPQPIKHAKIYFMHKIMHDWPEGDCIKILTHVRDAMAPRSRIFINDAILPDQDTPMIFAAFDICMLNLLSAKERSESMWTRLITSVGGLAIRKFWQAPELKGEGIVEVVRT